VPLNIGLNLVFDVSGVSHLYLLAPGSLSSATEEGGWGLFAFWLCPYGGGYSIRRIVDHQSSRHIGDVQFVVFVRAAQVEALGNLRTPLPLGLDGFGNG
jgi:hypothetical protein